MSGINILISWVNLTKLLKNRIFFHQIDHFEYFFTEKNISIKFSYSIIFPEWDIFSIKCLRSMNLFTFHKNGFVRCTYLPKGVFSPKWLRSMYIFTKRYILTKMTSFHVHVIQIFHRNSIITEVNYLWNWILLFFNIYQKRLLSLIWSFVNRKTFLSYWYERIHFFGKESVYQIRSRIFTDWSIFLPINIYCIYF